MAVAGADASVRPGTLVDLSASQSFYLGSKEGLTYEWSLETIPQGSSAQIYLPNKMETSFYADAAGIYVVRLIVKAKEARLSLPAYKVVRATGETAVIPVSNAGEDKVIEVHSTTSLSGSVTYSGTGQLSYLWKIESSPISSQPSLTNPSSVNPVFTSDREGEYILSFRGEAGGLKGNADFIKITLARKPVALVVNSQMIGLPNQPMLLDGDTSFDPNGLDLQYVWSVLESPQGSSTSFSDSVVGKTFFSADTEGSYLIQLVVQNAYLSSRAKQIRVQIISLSSFQASAGDNQVIIAGSRLNLSASSSTGTGLNYFWSLLDKPSLSQTEIIESQSVSPSVFIDKAGAYIFRLQVEKEGFLSSPGYVVFNAVLPSGTEIFSESFNPETASLDLPISQCAEIIRTIMVQNPEDKEFFILFENKGVKEVFSILNGQALTGRLEHETNSFIYPISLEESNTLSLRLRGTSSHQLKVKIIEKSSTQTFGTPPSLMSGDITVSLGGSGTTSITAENGLTYSVLESPLFGSASVSSSGVVTYTSDGSAATEDFILVKAVSSESLANVILIKVRFQ